MDNSETYIKMCEKAEEIHEHKIGDGDLYYWSVDEEVHLAFTETFPGCIVEHPEQWDYLHGRKITWLPRQGQLQEMVRGSNHNHLLAHKFALWCHGGEEFGIPVAGQRLPCNWSMEQLWLAFVMKEKYNKVWDGENWVKEKLIK